MRRLGWVIVLLGLACNSGSGDEEPAQAVVYAVSSLDGPGGAYYLERTGEEDLLLGESPSSYVDLLCIQPDGTGLVRWWPRDDFYDNPVRIETFVIGNDGVETGGASPFPEGVYATGCPFGWTADAYFVNVEHYDTGGNVISQTLRVSPDGTADPVEASTGHWMGFGEYAFDPSAERTNVWSVGQGIPRFVHTSPTGWLTGFQGSVVLQTRGGQVDLFSTAQLDRDLDPIRLRDATTPVPLGLSYRLSPSRTGVVLEEYGEWSTDAITVFRTDEGEVLHSHRYDQSREIGWTAGPTDSGTVVIVSDEAVWTADASGTRGELLRRSADAIEVMVAGEEELAVIGRTVDGEATVHTLHDLSTSSSREFVVPPECAGSGAVGRHAYFICDEARFGRVDLRSSALAFEDLGYLSPDAGGVVPGWPRAFDWNGERWHHLGFNVAGGDPYRWSQSVLLSPDGRPAIHVGKPGTLIERIAVFPPNPLPF